MNNKEKATKEYCPTCEYFKTCKELEIDEICNEGYIEWIEKIDVQLSLWSAIKLRIAGNNYYKVAAKMIKKAEAGK